MLSQQDIQQIQELYKSGLLKKDIAQKIGCSLTTVGKYTQGISVEKDEMVGRVFGRLTVIRRAPKKDLKNRCHRYICKCLCGNEVEVNGGALRSGHTTSCGCKQKEASSKNTIDITNERFGKLVVLERVSSGQDRHAIWKCQCDCGQIKEVEGTLLRNGLIRSCGCVKSWKEIEIARLLEENNIKYVREFSFDDLVSDNNKKLRFDFAVFYLDYLVFLIEYQGEQHYNQDNIWYDLKMQKHDEMKKEYCKKHNIPLYILDKDDNLSEFIKDLRKMYEL